MSKKFKIFSVCCGMLLAGVLSTQQSYADGTNIEIKGCVGSDSHKCKTDPDGTVYYGYFAEIIVDL